MRMVFTSYGINSAAVSLLFTAGLMLFDEYGQNFEKMVNIMSFYAYLSYGPALLTFCGFGMADIRNLSHHCASHGDNKKFNSFDIIVLFVASSISFIVTFCFATKFTRQLAESDLNDEGSVFFQSFMDHLKSERKEY